MSVLLSVSTAAFLLASTAAGASPAAPSAPGKPASASSASSAARAALPWIEDDYARAMAEAKRRGVPVFVEAWAPW